MDRRLRSGGQQWTEREARDALAELQDRGESVAAFAQRRGMSVQRVYYWRRRLRETAAPAFVAMPLTRMRNRPRWPMARHRDPALLPGNDDESASLAAFKEAVIDRLFSLNVKRAGEEQRTEAGASRRRSHAPGTSASEEGRHATKRPRRRAHRDGGSAQAGRRRRELTNARQTRSRLAYAMRP